MAEILINRKHNLLKEEVKSLIKPVIYETARAHGIRCRWFGDICQVNGPLRGYIKINDSSLILRAKLGFLASLKKRSIEHEIRKSLDQVLG